MIDFENSILYISARSPFARRVRLAFLEHEIKYDEKIENVFAPTEELIKVNPLVRVPTLKLKNGNIIIDSNQILELFYKRYSQSPLLVKSEADLITISQWSAVAIGLCDKCIDYFLETQRPKEFQDSEVFTEVSSIFERSLSLFESFIKNRVQILDHRLTQADLDMGTALAYISLRHPLQWKAKYPHAHRYFLSLNERPSFKKTLPPPAV